MAKIAHEEHDSDSWICSCGNRPDLEGFHPCNEQGELIEPDIDWPYLYRCDRCGLIIHDSGEIVGKTEVLP